MDDLAPRLPWRQPLAETQSAYPPDAVAAAMQDYLWAASDFLGRGTYGRV